MEEPFFFYCAAVVHENLFYNIKQRILISISMFQEKDLEVER